MVWLNLTMPNQAVKNGLKAKMVSMVSCQNTSKIISVDSANKGWEFQVKIVGYRRCFGLHNNFNKNDVQKTLSLQFFQIKTSITTSKIFSKTQKSIISWNQKFGLRWIFFAKISLQGFLTFLALDKIPKKDPGKEQSFLSPLTFLNFHKKPQNTTHENDPIPSFEPKFETE